jgi:hypothetical protein
MRPRIVDNSSKVNPVAIAVISVKKKIFIVTSYDVIPEPSSPLEVEVTNHAVFIGK